MRLKYLWIEDYRNLKNMFIDFQIGDGLTMFIGTNGSGKSNILEAISMIFSEAYQTTKNNILGCKYLLCYSIQNDCIYIAGKGNKSAIAKIYNKGIEKNISAFADLEGREAALHFIEMIFSKQEKVDVEEIQFIIERKFITNEHLPSNVIAIYSGEETRLWDDVYKRHYKQYITNIRKGVSSNLRMTYIDKTYWDIALFMLWFSLSQKNQEYLKEKIGIITVNEVDFEIDRTITYLENNVLLKNFIERLFPGDETVITLTEKEVCDRLCDRTVAAIVGDITHDEGKTSVPIQIRNALYTDIRQVFFFLIQACFSSGKSIINKINIKFNDYLDTHSLSEGEKKLLLIKCALDIGGNESSLVLLDEPDAHVHESRKKCILDLMDDYRKYDRQFVLTTHSPTLANLYDNEGRIMLERDENGNVTQIPFDKIKVVEKLTDGIWTATEQNIFFSSTKPLILTEGKSDIDFIQKAIELLGETESKYKIIDCDYLQFGGEGNADEFIKQLKPNISINKKVIVIFDRDDGGNKGFHKCIEKNNKNKLDAKIYKKDNWYYLMLPKTDEHNFTDFLIEDYFPQELKTKIIINRIEDGYGQLNAYDDVGSPKKYIKRIIGEKAFKEYTKDEFCGFKVLLDRIIGIIDGTAETEML